MRDLVAEHRLAVSQLVAPLFVAEGENLSESVPGLPGLYRLSVDRLIDEVKSLRTLGIRAVLLFAKVSEDQKDNTGVSALDPNGLLPRAIKALKTTVPDMVVMSDIALDPYSSYGHDGLVELDNRGEGNILNDETNAILGEMAVLHARCGADMVAPSDMMDGRVRAIRQALEAAHYTRTGIMAYSAKYASNYYGPFRAVLDSAPGFGDKKTYQMDPANGREAVAEARLDEAEGADIVMVKPGQPYLDILWRVREAVQIPVAVYQVSAEYAMLKLAAEKGWVDEKQAVLESLIGFRRAGADLIATYFAADAARWLNQ